MHKYPFVSSLPFLTCPKSYLALSCHVFSCLTSHLVISYFASTCLKKACLLNTHSLRFIISNLSCYLLNRYIHFYTDHHQELYDTVTYDDILPGWTYDISSLLESARTYVTIAEKINGVELINRKVQHQIDVSIVFNEIQDKLIIHLMTID